MGYYIRELKRALLRDPGLLFFIFSPRARTVTVGFYGDTVNSELLLRDNRLIFYLDF